jgi:chromosomal replication initiation ATPase DnaA
MTLQLSASELITILRKHIAGCGLIRSDAQLAIQFSTADGQPLQDITARLTQVDDPSEILAAVCEEFNVTSEALLGPSRPESLVIPRHMLMSLLYLSGMNLTDVANYVGRRDHNSATNAVENVRDWIETQPAFAQRARSLAGRFGLDLSDLRRRSDRHKTPQIAVA